MILEHEVGLDSSIVRFYENGTVQVLRSNGEKDYLTSNEAQEIADYYNDV